jgi:iron complex outermembrane receptor protein
MRTRFPSGSLLAVVGLSCAMAALLGLPVEAQSTGVLEVKVSDGDGGALPGATVVLVGQRRECTTDAAGVCRFDGLAPGRYDVSVRMAGFMGARAEADVATAAASLAFTLSRGVHFSESVTVSTAAVDTFEAFQPTTVIGGEELTRRVSTNLGDTLGSQPGVNVRAFGPGPSRPVVRGFDGDRVLVLENGARTGDLSSQSGDHGTTLDTASAAQIEVVRGAATLLYGSNALGGVVNLVSDEIPTKPVKRTHGAFNLSGGSANKEAAGTGNVTFGNERWAFRVAGAGNRTGDVETPEGELPNSQTDLKSGGAAFSRTAATGYLGASYGFVDTHYGIPFVEEGETTLHPRRHRVDVRGEKRNMGGFIEGVKFVGGYRNYKHDEIEGDGTIATSFKNTFTEGQLFLNHRPTGRLKGTFGFWGTHRDYSTAGEEALAPPVKQNSQAAFVYEELTYHHFGLQFGARLDHTKFDTEPTPDEEPEVPSRLDRTFTEVSGSVGLLGFINDEVTVAFNLTRAARNPSLEELYNFGPHAGNFAFEIGNSALESERGLGADLSLRFRKKRFTGEVTVFSNWVDNFIFPLQTGEDRDEFTVVQYTSRDALLRGFEAHVDVGLTDKLFLELGGDGVHGQARDNDDPLPRIPPYRGWAGLRYEGRTFSAGAELRGAAKQDRVYGVETPTDDYALLNAHASYKLIRGKAVHIFTLRLDNAGDKLWRNHLNFIKDQTPEMGRSFKVVYSARF